VAQVGFDNDIYEGKFPDPTTPPNGVSLQAIASEVDRFAAQHGLLDLYYPTSNAQVVVATSRALARKGSPATATLVPKFRKLTRNWPTAALTMTPRMVVLPPVDTRMSVHFGPPRRPGEHAGATSRRG
jgi:hypothetical protein